MHTYSNRQHSTNTVLKKKRKRNKKYLCIHKRRKRNKREKIEKQMKNFKTCLCRSDSRVNKNSNSSVRFSYDTIKRQQ